MEMGRWKYNLLSKLGYGFEKGNYQPLYYVNIGEPKMFGIPEGATMRLADGHWVTSDKEIRNNFICSSSFGGRLYLNYRCIRWQWPFDCVQKSEWRENKKEF